MTNLGESTMSLYSYEALASANDSSRKILTRANRAYEESAVANNALWSEGDRDTRVYCGDARLYSEIYPNQPFFKRAQFSFNHVRPAVSHVEGWQRQHRKTITAVPVENADNETADQYTKLFFWATNRSGFYETFSDACKGSLITGMNMLHIYPEWVTDPISGNIKVDCLPMNALVLDPYFRKQDLSDCNFIMRRSYVTKAEARALLPSAADEIMDMAMNSAQDGRFQFMPETYAFDLGRYLSYDEFYYKDFRVQKLLMDAQTGSIMEWRWENKQEELELFLHHHPNVIMYEQEIPTIRLAVIINNKVMSDIGNPSGSDTYPFVPLFCYFQPDIPYYSLKIQGIVRALRDAQFLYNRRRQIEDDILSSQVNSGFIYKEDALVNPKDIFMTGQGKGIALKSEAQITDVVKIPSAEIHPSVFQVSENYAKEMITITGLSEENLAASTDDIAGVLSMLRQGAGLIGLQGIFDGWDKALKLCGKKMFEIIQNNWAPGKVERILNDQPQPQFYNQAFGIYDIFIEEGVYTTTQRQQQLAQLIQFKQLEMPIPTKTIIDAAVIENKKRLMEDIEAIEKQQAQSQQMQMQVEMMKLQAETRRADARAQADYGQAVERASRVNENEALAVERRAQAVHDENAAVLNLIKAIKELKGMDIEHLSQLVSMQGIIKAQEQQITQEATNGEIRQGGNANTAVKKVATKKDKVSKIK